MSKATVAEKKRNLKILKEIYIHPSDTPVSMNMKHLHFRHKYPLTAASIKIQQLSTQKQLQIGKRGGGGVGTLHYCNRAFSIMIKDDIHKFKKNEKERIKDDSLILRVNYLVRGRYHVCQKLIRFCCIRA